MEKREIGRKRESKKRRKEEKLAECSANRALFSRYKDTSVCRHDDKLEEL